MEWVSVKERLPAERELVLIAVWDGPMRVASYFQWESMPKPIWHGVMQSEEPVTHWIPLPSPPTSTMRQKESVAK